MNIFQQHIDQHQAAIDGLYAIEADIEAAARVISAALNRGSRILLCGNGGSAADAQHIAAELVGRYVAERRGLPAIALSTDTSMLTAIGNDYGFEHVFARQVQAQAQPGDVLVGISTSGNSPNVLAAVDAARRLGCYTIGLLGRDGGQLREQVDLAVVVGAPQTAHIQECHILIGHVWCAWADAHLADDEPPTGILDETQLLAARATARAAGERVVMTNGCFDILHPGHIEYLRQARALGERLLVAVNDDDSVGRLKGNDRPVNSLAHRMQMLAALGCVDWVTAFSEDTPERLICAVLPDLLVKGGDYRIDQIAGAACVQAAGGEVKVLDFVDGHSTTALIERIRARF